jgi:hypothetical protein
VLPAETKPEPKKWKNLNNVAKKLNNLIIQKYLEKPSLINGRKYDIRFFMLVACTKPYLVMTNSGYIRVSLEDYNIDTFGAGDKKDKATHLTNASVQKGHPKFKELKESTIMSMKELGEYMV